MSTSKKKLANNKPAKRKTTKATAKKSHTAKKKTGAFQKSKRKLPNSKKRTKVGKTLMKSVKWLNHLRSPGTEKVTPDFSQKLSTIKDEYGREVFTGRHLIKLNREVGLPHLESMAKNASLRIASTDHLSLEATVNSNELLKSADGVIFPNAKVAMLNSQLEEQIDFLTSSKGGQGNFTYAEPERFVYPAATSKKNLSFADNNSFAWGLQVTNILQSNRTGSGIKMAILDTGLNTDHVDFRNRKIVSASFIPGEDVKDVVGHGTRCAGIACGARSTAGPRYGVATGVELFIGKVISKEVQGTDTSLLDGIEWALKNGCRVINLSVVRAIARGETGFSETYEKLATIALSNNCLIIAAAGNESNRKFRIVKPVAEPANCPSIMAVGALDQNINVANFSCGGLIQDGGQIDIAGPGVDILSSHLKSTYNSDSGTSFASPIVAGIAALLWEENPQATAAEIWMKLIQKAKRLEINASDVGAGLAFLS